MKLTEDRRAHALLLANRKRELGIGGNFGSGRRLGDELAFTHGIDLGRGRSIGL